MKHAHTTAALLGCLAILFYQSLASAAIPCSLRIGEYPGSSQKAGREGTSDVYAVDHELVQTIDPLTGQANGVRQHKPLTVLKVIDKATPGLNKACATGQNLKSVILEFYRIDPDTRSEVKYYTITLMNARVIGDKVMVPTTMDANYASYGHMEEIRFVYETIEWNWIPDSIVEIDHWAHPGVAAASSPKSAAATKEPAKEIPVPTDSKSNNANVKPAATTSLPENKTVNSVNK